MKRLLPALTLNTLLTAATEPQTITGIITDTMCGSKHTMTKGQPDDECARFAAKPVKVTGTADSKAMTVKVITIEPAE